MVSRKRDIMQALEVTYRIRGTETEVRVHAESVLLEQTVETPADVARRYPFVRDEMMGELRSLDSAGDGTFLARMALPTATASVDAAQFLNVLFGNSSLHERVTLEDFDLADALPLFRGPQFGISGIRAAVGVSDRPLTCTAVKPVGIPFEEVVRLCRTFAEGGVDLIKDDHYFADHPFCPFDDRVRACLDAVEESNARTGRRTIYVPNLSGSPDQVLRQLDVAQQVGVRAVMAAPMLLGMPFFHELTHRRLDVPVLAHPSFSGIQGIAPAASFGKLFRLFGADAVIFANYGGRFSYSQDVCAGIAKTLRTPFAGAAPAFPVPAGGMHVDRTAELLDFFGNDTILLIGGSLLQAGDRLLDATLSFTERVRQAARSAAKNSGGA